ncbi:MAG TPA: hypothetical protein VFQ61_06915, partial [Polyangiaceae bacterium]|nr:hypothetical protein [Polyangiaceae bacterium]
MRVPRGCGLQDRAGPDVPGGEQVIEYTLFDLPKKIITGPGATQSDHSLRISSNGATVEERFAL